MSKVIFIRTKELVKEVGEANYKRLIATEYQLQRYETYLPTSAEIFAAFEKKFISYMPLLDYFPFFEELMISGMKIFADDNYSAVELRLIIGLAEFKDENFNVIPNDQIIDRLVIISKKIKKKYNLGKD
jgi:hypothetical protein